MKYLKICSFAVALLLLASPAMADMECNLDSESYDLRAESMHESLGVLMVECTWEDDDFLTAGTEVPMFDLEIAFSTDVTNSDDMEPYLEFEGNTVATDNASVNTMVMPDDIGSDDIEWEDVRLPIAGTFGTSSLGYRQRLVRSGWYWHGSLCLVHDQGRLSRCEQRRRP